MVSAKMKSTTGLDVAGVTSDVAIVTGIRRLSPGLVPV